ncbi:MAG: DNA polymerase III subunit delta [Parcubacteria group bacterium Athens1014_10]|nr:MAG: DNA polymerase III subunit delta [Parcubacteria group bacterium Athens1014_10]TSD05151.1 MAG: DNA polymerase III subunit delta [Parcubacteria group bacterium Athens0714_12]
MIIFLHGQNTYSSRGKLNQLKEKFKREIDKSGGNIFIFDEENVSLDKLKNALFTHSFLTKKKMVILENAKSFKKNILDELSPWFKKLEEDKNLILIFWEKEIKKQSPKDKAKKNAPDLISQLKKIKYVFEFPMLSEEKLKQWVVNEVKNQNSEIDFQALNLLIAFVGDNLWQMSQEINKLSAYKGKEMINKNDVELLTKAKLDENIFNLVDAVGNKNIKVSLKLINEQIESGISPIYLLTMLIRQFKILLQVKDLLEKKIKSFEINSHFKLHPFVLKKAVQQSQKYSLEELKKIYAQLLDIDFKSKTTQINPKILLNLFVAKIYLA